MTYDIIIIGGGLVGAAAALSLKQQGRNVVVLEICPPSAEPAKLQQTWDARIYAISPANQAFLQLLNAWPDESRIQAVQKMDVRGDHGGRIEFNAADIHASRLTSIVENRWLLAALWQQIRALDIPVICARASALETDIETATLTLDTGETLSAKLIIGADGASSWLRTQAGIRVNEKPYHHHGVVANFHTEQDHNGTAFQWFSNGEVLAYLPLPDRKISIVWSTPTPEKLTTLSPEALAAAVSAQGGYILGPLAPLSPAFAFELILRRPKTTVGQRILLMGDAAHTIHPLAGQGVNLGFGDVIEFATLSSKEKDPGNYQLLKKYAQNRLEPVRTMQMSCNGLFLLFGEQTLPALPWLRNTGLNLVNATPMLKHQLIKHAMGL